MKKTVIYILFFIHYSLNFTINAHIVTMNKWGGRLGDQLFLYMKAKWIEHKLGIPFLYSPFNCSQYLNLHKKELLYSEKDCSNYKKKIIKWMPIEKDLEDEPTNFCTDFYFQARVILTDKQFLAHIKEMVQPIIPIQKPQIRKNFTGVGIHIRGFDRPSCSSKNMILVLRYPPEEYYLEQISKMYELLKTPLHIFIVSDGNTQKIKESLEIKINNPDIFLDCFDNKNTDNDKHLVIRDFYTLMKLDYLIRPMSNFSKAAEVLGNHKIIIYPLKANNENEYCFISEIALIKNNH